MSDKESFFLNSIDDLLKLIGMSKINAARFIKADGTVRLMRFTTDLELVPVSMHPSNSKKKRKPIELPPNMIHVFDLDKKEWRTLNLEKVSMFTPVSIDNRIIYHMKRSNK